MKKIAVAVFASVSAAAGAFAAVVSADDARCAVQGWVNLKEALGGDFAGKPASVDEYVGADGKGRFYVVSFDGGGYVAVSGDDGLVPVLAYSSEGRFAPGEENPMWCMLSARAAGDAEALAATAATAGARLLGGRSLASDNVSRWNRLRAAGGAGGARALGKSTTSPKDLRVPEMLKSDWSQTYLGNGRACFNLYTPNNWPCGCVATSGSQAMRWFEWPKGNVTAKTVSCSVGGSPRDLTMKGGTYDWENMPADVNARSSSASAAEAGAWCEAIGKLTYDLGVSVGMAYNSNDSAASIQAFSVVLRTVFGYSSAVYFNYKAIDPDAGSMPDDCLKRTIIPNLEAKRPCVVGVKRGENHDHAIVADGYGYGGDGALYVHFNMGWANTGGSNAWYNPPEFDTGLSTYYDVVKEIVCNIFTTEGRHASIASGRVLDASSGEPVAGAAVTARYGNEAAATATSDERGVYALVLPPAESVRTYSITASRAAFGGSSTCTASAAMTCGMDGFGTAGFLSNSFGNDIQLQRSAVARPAVASGGGSTLQYGEKRTVELSCETEDATIRYTLDGTEPTDASAVYSGPFDIPLSAPGSVTLKAKAFKTDFIDSETLTAVYTMLERAAAPSFNPKPGTVFFSSAFAVAIDCGTEGAETRYTTDGSEPTRESALYDGAFAISATCVVKAKAFKDGMSPSETVAAEYVRLGVIGENLAREASQEAGTSQEVSLPIPGVYSVSFGYSAGGAVEVLAVQGGATNVLAQVAGGAAGATNVAYEAAAGACELVARGVSGGGAVPAEIADISISIPATEENLKAYWVYETARTFGATGTWTGDAEASGGAVRFKGFNTFAPSAAADGRIVELTVTARSVGVAKSLPQPAAGTKAAFALGRDEGGSPSFMLCTSDAAGMKWECVSAQGVSGPQAGVDYTVRFALDCTNRTYSAALVSGGADIRLATAEGKSVFDFADKTGGQAVAAVAFDGAGSMSMLHGTYGNLVAMLFSEGQDIALGGDASVTLTALQAAWLNSMGPYDAVLGKAGGMSAEEFVRAYLLNLDITQEGAGLVSFRVSGIDVSDGSVTVRVRLERSGAMPGGEGVGAPINGILKLYGGDSPKSKELLSATSVEGKDFGDGPEAVFTFPRAGAARFFRPAIVAP